MVRLLAVAGGLFAVAVSLVLLSLDGSSDPAPPEAAASALPAAREVALATVTAARPEELVAVAGPIELYRSATCGCCDDNATYLTDAGFEVEGDGRREGRDLDVLLVHRRGQFVHDLCAEVTGFKSASGVPEELCPATPR